MTLGFDPAWALAVFLVFLRFGAVFLLSPVFAGLAGLVTLRVLLTLALSGLMVQGFGVRADPSLLAGGQLLVAALLELFVGATLSFGVFAAFGAFSVAGKILDIQTGFGLGNVYDPVTRSGAPLFATMLNMLGVVVFFGIDGHHALVRGLAFSLKQSPPGQGFSSLDAEPVIAQFGLMFSLGVSLIIPVILCLLLVEVALAVVSRVLPQMNVFVAGVPVKIVGGLALTALTLRSMEPAMQRIYGGVFHFWQQMLAA